MASSTVTLARGPQGLADIWARELPQKDNLCGCFWGAVVLAAGGIDGLDQDAVALAAGTTLPDGDPAEFVPEGETPRRDYRVQLPPAKDARASGTAASALAGAIERLAGGTLSALPVAGVWSASSVEGLVEIVAEAAPEAALLANLRTGLLWGSRPDPRLLLSHVAGEDVEAPPAEWDTGHFLNLAGMLRGPARALLLVRDSYPRLGWRGYHFQPAEALARALERGDGREGGVLCIAGPASARALGRELAAAGYELRHWDNGTPPRGG
ncbi:MAG: hypothetical protein ICV74_04680 [Thermoleophilia bacterium]|nr:hypothetical protein [Thermoleophilia bacterium]